MFDIGFTEILLTAVVGLIVVGPNNLPKTMRTIFRYFREFKNGVNNIKNEIEKDLALEDVQKELEKHKELMRKALEAQAKPFENIKDDLQKEVSDVKDLAGEYQSEINNINQADKKEDTSANGDA